MTVNKALVAITAVTAITIAGLILGHNGALVYTAIAAIAALGGHVISQPPAK